MIRVPPSEGLIDAANTRAENRFAFLPQHCQEQVSGKVAKDNPCPGMNECFYRTTLATGALSPNGILWQIADGRSLQNINTPEDMQTPAVTFFMDHSRNAFYFSMLLEDDLLPAS